LSACQEVRDAGDLATYAWGLSFIGNWFGDASGGGTWIDAKCLGGNFAGNRFASAGSGSVSIRLTHSEGTNISGNHIECPIGIDVSGFAIGLAVMGNKFFGVTTPVSNLGSITPTTAAFLGNSGLANYIA
jgi:nitrous oxidase accessory protein NosD